VTLATILCPIDRSPVSRRAFDYAVSLGRWAGARLTVLEVIDVTPPISSTAIPEMLLIPDEVRAAVRDDLSALMSTWPCSDRRLTACFARRAVRC
jgi:nucleotide-binding universal stress UspA family protein